MRYKHKQKPDPTPKTQALSPTKQRVLRTKCQSVARLSHKILEIILNHRIAEVSVAVGRGGMGDVGSLCARQTTNFLCTLLPSEEGLNVNYEISNGGKWQPETCPKPDISNAGCSIIRDEAAAVAALATTITIGCAHKCIESCHQIQFVMILCTYYKRWIGIYIATFL